MKKMIQLMCVCLVTFLSSCAKFHGTNQSVWSEGLWIIPWVVGIGAAVCWYLTIKSWRTGGTQGWIWENGVTPKYVVDNNHFKISQAAFFWFAVILTVALIVIIVAVNAGR